MRRSTAQCIQNEDPTPQEGWEQSHACYWDGEDFKSGVMILRLTPHRRPLGGLAVGANVHECNEHTPRVSLMILRLTPHRRPLRFSLMYAFIVFSAADILSVRRARMGKRAKTHIHRRRACVKRPEE